MTTVDKIDSNDTGLRLAYETSPKVLPVTPVWLPQEPNSYGSYGGKYKAVYRTPINDDRQNKKGAIVDSDVTAEFPEDLTQTNIQDKIEAFMYAAFRKKSEATVATVTTSTFTTGTAVGPDYPIGTLVFSKGQAAANNNGLFKCTTDGSASTVTCATQGLTAATGQVGVLSRVGFQFASGDLQVVMGVDGLPTLTTDDSTGKDLTTLGLVPGELIFIGDDSDAAFSFAGTVGNNCFARVRSVAAHVIVLDKSENTMDDDDGSGKTIRVFFGRVVKNESDRTLIITKTAQLERTLGASDDGSSDEQAQYVTGAQSNVLTLDGKSTDKITVTYNFMGRTEEFINAGDDLKDGTRPSVVEADAFNTTSDVRDYKITIVNAANSAPVPLFAFAQDVTLTIDNKLTADKAIKVLGNFAVTKGKFTVSIKSTVYFVFVSSVAAVRDNADVSFWAIFAKDNAGMAIDLPLLTVSTAMPDVKVDDAITIPIEAQAAKGSKVDPNLTHTAAWSFFDYLPDAAMPIAA